LAGGCIPESVACGLRLNGIQIPFDLAFEKAGFLYVLKVVETNDSQMIRDPLKHNLGWMTPSEFDVGEEGSRNLQKAEPGPKLRHSRR
jgi:hypothetical protein